MPGTLTVASRTSCLSGSTFTSSMSVMSAVAEVWFSAMVNAGGRVKSQPTMARDPMGREVSVTSTPPDGAGWSRVAVTVTEPASSSTVPLGTVSVSVVGDWAEAGGVESRESATAAATIAAARRNHPTGRDCPVVIACTVVVIHAQHLSSPLLIGGYGCPDRRSSPGAGVSIGGPTHPGSSRSRTRSRRTPPRIPAATPTPPRRQPRWPGRSPRQTGPGRRRQSSTGRSAPRSCRPGRR